MQRRQFIATTCGALMIASLAGCASSDPESGSGSGGDSTPTNEPTDEPTDTPESTATPTPEPTTSTSTPTPTATATATSTPQQALTIQEESLEEDALGSARVVGKVENTSGKTQDYIQVSAKFFNSADERVGEGMDNATDVSAGTVVNFEIISTTEFADVADYELTASTTPG